MISSAFGDALRTLWGPGLVFLVVIIWIIRRVIRAARIESQLEEQRLREWMKNEVAHLQSSKAEPRLMRVPPSTEREKALAATRAAAAAPAPAAAPGSPDVSPPPPLDAAPGPPPPLAAPADMTGVTAAELDVVRPLFRTDGVAPARVLWVRSIGSHIAFCERREANPPSTIVREVITVVKVAGGKVVGKWQFG